jgi:subtilisin family serine protease
MGGSSLHRAAAGLLAAGLGLILAACAGPTKTAAGPRSDPLIIVAVAEGASTRAAVGAAARADYRRAGGYNGTDAALDMLAAIAAEHHLAEVDAWTIPTLNWRCALLQPAAGADAAALLERLARDPRVALAQPLNDFQTLAEPGAYNDPYLSLQTGFASIDAAGAQRASRGDGVTVALIDTGLDPQHPDLLGRTATGRDFAGHAPEAGSERHGTEVAGIIAASANNGIGIVGVAPGVRLLPLRACWGGGAGQAARCNSFTLARALAAALADKPDVINLSLAGPRDPLLERLLAQALARGIVVVGAVPPGGLRDGFPSAMPGVLAVASAEDSITTPGVLAAPGRRVLTLAPGGGYDYASGSSMAAAHVTGVVALLRALDHKLDGPALQALLAGHSATVDACVALQRLRPGLSCAASPPH